MTASRILIKTDQKNRVPLDPAPDTGWYLLGGIGLVFAIVSFADLALAFYPFAFGDAEWEFGTVTTVLDGLPLFTIGLGLGLGSMVARGRLAGVRILSVVFGLIGVMLVLLTVRYAGHISQALGAVTEPAIKVGLRKAIITTLAQGTLYPIGFFWIGTLGWRHAKRGVTP
ncbi:MAG: hypothetical protein ABI587_14535 [Gemmatimonadales bacterium]